MSFEPGGQSFIVAVIGFRHVNPSSTHPGSHFLRHVNGSSNSSPLHGAIHVNASVFHPGGQSISTLPPTSPYFCLNALTPLHPHPQSRRFSSASIHSFAFFVTQLFFPPPHPQSLRIRLAIC